MAARRHGGTTVLFLTTILAAITSVSGIHRAATAAPAAHVGAQETGIASWYGAQHQGRPTASGEIFDLHKLTAAHPTLPLGTRLHVTNRRNGRSVDVRVNDRGPYVAGRSLDLSRAAAVAIDGVSDGLIPVTMRVVAAPTPRPRR